MAIIHYRYNWKTFTIFWDVEVLQFDFLDVSEFIAWRIVMR